MPITNGVLTITPEDISLGKHFFDAFGHYESEISASWLVSFAQARGEGWEPFTDADIEQFYAKSGYVNFSFNRLLTSCQILKREIAEGCVYHFTEEFISRCYKAASKKEAVHG